MKARRVMSVVSRHEAHIVAQRLTALGHLHLLDAEKETTSFDPAVVLAPFSMRTHVAEIECMRGKETAWFAEKGYRGQRQERRDSLPSYFQRRARRAAYDVQRP